MPNSGNNDSTASTESNFGNGESWGGATHGTTASGRDVTFAEDHHTGGIYIADGHTDSSFWGSGDNKGHDHYGPNGESYHDRGKYSDD